MSSKSNSKLHRILNEEEDTSPYMWTSGNGATSTITQPPPKLNTQLQAFETTCLCCPICGDFFQNTVSLRACRHSFCSYCIRQSLSIQRRSMKRVAQCPVCREDIEGDNTRAIVPNWGLQDVVDMFKETRPLLFNSLITLQSLQGNRVNGDMDEKKEEEVVDIVGAVKNDVLSKDSNKNFTKTQADEDTKRTNRETQNEEEAQSENSRERLGRNCRKRNCYKETDTDDEDENDDDHSNIERHTQTQQNIEVIEIDGDAMTNSSSSPPPPTPPPSSTIFNTTKPIIGPEPQAQSEESKSTDISTDRCAILPEPESGSLAQDQPIKNTDTNERNLIRNDAVKIDNVVEVITIDEPITKMGTMASLPANPYAKNTLVTSATPSTSPPRISNPYRKQNRMMNNQPQNSHVVFGKSNTSNHGTMTLNPVQSSPPNPYKRPIGAITQDKPLVHISNPYKKGVGTITMNNGNSSSPPLQNPYKKSKGAMTNQISSSFIGKHLGNIASATTSKNNQPLFPQIGKLNKTATTGAGSNAIRKIQPSSSHIGNLFKNAASTTHNQTSSFHSKNHFKNSTKTNSHSITNHHLSSSDNSKNQNLKYTIEGRQYKNIPVYHGMNKKKLQDLCQQEGLSTMGKESELKERHLDFILLWNAECDGKNPRSKDELLKLITRRESTKKKEELRLKMTGADKHGQCMTKLKENIKASESGENPTASMNRMSSGNALFDKQLKVAFANLTSQIRSREKL